MPTKKLKEINIKGPSFLIYIRRISVTLGSVMAGFSCIHIYIIIHLTLFFAPMGKGDCGYKYGLVLVSELSAVVGVACYRIWDLTPLDLSFSIQYTPWIPCIEKAGWFSRHLKMPPEGNPEGCKMFTYCLADTECC